MALGRLAQPNAAAQPFSSDDVAISAMNTASLEAGWVYLQRARSGGAAIILQRFFPLTAGERAVQPLLVQVFARLWK